MKNHEDLENLIIPHQNLENHEVLRIQWQNSENLGNLVIPPQNKENHKKY